MDNHQFKEEENESVGELSTVCSQMVLKCLYLARIGRPDILWSVNKIARAVTKWTKACDKRLARLISCIHHTCDYRQYGYVGNTAKQCRLGLFQDSDFAVDLEDSKSTSGGALCVFGRHTFVPISWMCKKQTSVSNSSTEAELVSLDASLRMDGIPALDLWHLVIEVFHSPLNQTNKSKDSKVIQGNLSQVKPPNLRNQIPTKHTNLDLTNVDHVSSHVQSSVPVLCCMSSSPFAGCARNKRPYPTVLQNQKSFRWMLVWEWTGSLLLTNGTWWLKCYFHRRERRLQKFLDPTKKPNVIYTDNFVEFGKACEDLSWNHCTSTPHRSETNGIAESSTQN